MSNATEIKAGPEGVVGPSGEPPDPDDYFEPEEPGEAAERLLTVAEAQQAVEPIEGGQRTRPIVAEGGPTTLAKFLDLSDVQMRAIDLRVALMLACRRIRTEAGMSQAEAARRLGTSQPQIAEAEKPGREPTFDLLIPLFFAVGGTSDQLCDLIRATDESIAR